MSYGPKYLLKITFSFVVCRKICTFGESNYKKGTNIIKT